VKKGFNAIVAFCIVSLVAIVCLLAYFEYEYQRECYVVESQLNTFKIVRNAKVDSPSVVITVSSLEGFLSKISEMNASTIYTSNGGAYYVFNSAMTIAYSYDVSAFLKQAYFYLTLATAIIVVICLCVSVVVKD